MPPLPAADLRQNVLTLAVPTDRLPAVARCMTQLLPAEDFDPHFQGQKLETTYFDTESFRLRKRRLKKKNYLALRIRCYGDSDTYALSLKSEQGKFRIAIESELAELYIQHGFQPEDLSNLLPADLLARLIDLTGGQALCPVVTVCFTRYAVENAIDRLTLDTTITTNTGKVFPANVLEDKTIAVPAKPLKELRGLGLPTIKLSKFLWATSTV